MNEQKKSGTKSEPQLETSAIEECNHEIFDPGCGRCLYHHRAISMLLLQRDSMLSSTDSVKKSVRHLVTVAEMASRIKELQQEKEEAHKQVKELQEYNDALRELVEKNRLQLDIFQVELGRVRVRLDENDKHSANWQKAIEQCDELLALLETSTRIYLELKTEKDELLIENEQLRRRLG